MALPGQNATWTREEIDALDREWRAGTATAEIARQVGKTKNAVIGKAHRIGLPPRPSPLKRRSGLPPRRKVENPNAPTTPRGNAPGGSPCCWPIGAPGERGFRFCDAPALPGRSYCAAHHRRSITKARPATNP